MKILAAFLIFTLPAFGGFGHMRSIRLNHLKAGSSDSADFTAAIQGTFPFLATAPNGGAILKTVSCGVSGIGCPADLIFTRDPACTQLLSWEIERYNPITGQLVAWVKVPLLSHVADTVIYACYSNPAADTFAGGSLCAAWDGGARTIYHLDNPDIKDWGCGGVDLVSSGSLVGTSGAVGPAVSFPAASQYASMEAHNYSTVSGVGNGSVTLSAWVKFSTFLAQDTFPVSFVGLDNTGYPGNAVTFGLDGDNKVLFILGDDGGYTHRSSVSPVPLETGSWYHLAGTWDGSHMIFYLNGAEVSSTSLQFSRTDRFVGLNFALWESGRVSQLVLDEVKLAATARSADWVLAEYNNQSSPATFYTLGPDTVVARAGGSSGAGSQAIVE